MTAGAATLALTALRGVGRVSPGDDLAAIIVRAAKDSGCALASGDVVAVDAAVGG